MKIMKKHFVEDIPRRKFLQMGLKGGIALAATPALMTQLLSCKKATSVAAKLDLDPQIYNRTIQKALEKEGEFADVYVENRISRNIVMEESKFKSAEFGINQGAGVRVISGDKTGFAYTDDITEENLRRNPNSRFFLSIEISYPNREDAAVAKEEGFSPGGLIMIHGQPNEPRKSAEYYARNDWTDGCIAVSNLDMMDIWRRAPLGIPIEIRP